MNSEAHPEAHVSTEDRSWSTVVDQIRAGDASGMEELYHTFSKGIRYYLYRQIGPQDLDDKVHDVFLIITQAIQRGELREPDRLMGYVRTIVRRQVAAHIDTAVQSRRNSDISDSRHTCDHAPNPERGLIEQQNEELAYRILNSMQKRDREILIRFYLDEQPADRICQEMGLSETQFRLIKSRAKARFGQLGRRRFSMRSGFQR